MEDIRIGTKMFFKKRSHVVELSAKEIQKDILQQGIVSYVIGQLDSAFTANTWEPINVDLDPAQQHSRPCVREHT